MIILHVLYILVHNLIHTIKLKNNNMEKLPVQKSNIKHHDNGVITYTVDTELWCPRTENNRTMDRGWGNGYICIPDSHPWVQRCKDKLKENIISGIDSMKKLGNLYIPSSLYDMVIPHPSQEWTYGEHEETLDQQLNPIQDGGYYVLGFDCNHSWNTIENSPESKVVSWIEEYVPIVNK